MTKEIFGKKQNINYQNRANKRKLEKGLKQNLNVVSSLSGELNRSAKTWEENNGRFISEIVFQHPTDINSFLSSRRKIPDIMRLVTTHNGDQSHRIDVTGYAENDIFEVNLSGMSLSKLEKMQYPLTAEEIKQASKLFSDGKTRFTKRPPTEKTVTTALTIFLLQNKLTNGVQVPQNLKPIYERGTQVLDYYTDAILDMGTSDEQNTMLHVELLDKAPLVSALGVYIPARYGISPSSVNKALIQKGDGMTRPDRYAFNKYVQMMKHEVDKSYSSGALPEDLQKHIFYDDARDKVAQSILETHYQKLTNEEQVSIYDEVEMLQDEHSLYFRKFSDYIKKSPDKRIKIDADNPVIKDFVVTSYDKKNLMVIMNLKGGDTSVTLEIDHNGNFFGFPPKIASNNEMIMYSCMKDVFSPLIEVGKKMFPDIEESRKKFQPQVRIPDEVPIPMGEYVPVVKEPKKKTFVQNLVRKKTEVADFAQIGEESERKFVVLHSRKQVEDMMGKYPREKDVDRIMRKIKDIEWGRAPFYKTIDYSGGSFQVGRVGSFRMVFNHMGKGFYSLEAVGDREYAYEDFADHKV